MILRVWALVKAGLCLALCMILPLLTGQIPEIGKMLSPMHIPVLLCGFVCGWPWGAAVGLIAPLLRFLIFGMPYIFPTGVAMMGELMVYGAAAGFFYQRLPDKPWAVYASLIAAMVIGRLAWGAVQWMLLVAGSIQFSFQAFLAGAFLQAWPGIICHLLIIPPVVIALQKAGLTEK